VGIFNNSLLTLDRVLVSSNVGRANGPVGAAQGGGIWNGVELSGPPVQLALDHTLVIRNSLAGSHGIKLQGGGLFTMFPVALRHSLITLNRPGQCFGCARPAPSPSSHKITSRHDRHPWQPEPVLSGR
jgi:hypothetical protein